jgi:hypothetical protein
VTPASFNLWLRNADNLNFSTLQSCSPRLQFNSNFYRIRNIRFLSKISSRLIIFLLVSLIRTLKFLIDRFSILAVLQLDEQSQNSKIVLWKRDMSDCKNHDYRARK